MNNETTPKTETAEEIAETTVEETVEENVEEAVEETVKEADAKKEKPRKGPSLMQKRMMKGYLFILPWLIGFIAFYLRSLIMTVQFSLSDLSVSFPREKIRDFLFALFPK